MIVRWAPMVLLALSIGAVGARAQTVSVAIIEHGLYTAETVRTEKLPGGFSSNVVQNICHIMTTEAVPTKMGVQFGFRFRVDGSPAGALVDLKRVTRFPVPVKPPTNPIPQSVSEHVIQTRVGATSYAGFGFDHDWELVRGPWIFEMWQGDRMLSRQRFEIGDGERPKAPRSSENCFQLSVSLMQNTATGGTP